MIKIIKQSPLWFYIPFAIFRMKNVKRIAKWVTEPNDYKESLKRNDLTYYVVLLNFFYCIIFFKLILSIL
jgi:hypothetical protein